MTIPNTTESITYKDLLKELRKPGNVFVGALISHDVIFVQAVKSALINDCKNSIEGEYENLSTGWNATRYSDGTLYLDAAHE